MLQLSERRGFYGTLAVANGKIESIVEDGPARDDANWIFPGLVDAHVHIESSMLLPAEFARPASVHGTVATVSDPHEIANVCGVAGVRFMINNAKRSPLKFHFGAPSCVPATTFETAGAAIDADEIRDLMQDPDIHYLAEVMNYPGVLNNDPDLLQKIAHAKAAGKPSDGHAPGLRGEDAQRYVAAGLSTDHECTTIEEAKDKLAAGMKILIRQGSAAKNFDALIPLLQTHEDSIMFCSDDKHPDDLIAGHINQLCARALQSGADIFQVIKAACVNPHDHYKLNTGLLRAGDPADFIIVSDRKRFEVSETFINGECVAREGKTLIASQQSEPVNQFNIPVIKVDDIAIEIEGKVNVIEAAAGSLITGRSVDTPGSDDVLKIVVVNRYNVAKPAVGFVRGFGLKQGAIASSVAHDSHNIVAAGIDDESIVKAVNLVVEAKGGISAVSEDETMLLPLPVAGLMSADDAYEVASAYTRINSFAVNDLQSKLPAPFMTLSFMALPVIPSLKMTDKGLFDVEEFGYASVYADEASDT